MFKYLFLFISFLLCSCGINEEKPIVKDGIANIVLSDKLEHGQYYEKNDSWDFSSLYLIITFDNGETEKLPLNSKFVEYSFTPEAPALTEPKMYYVTVYNVVYIDYKNDKHDVPSKNYSIWTIPYPYNEKSDIIKFVPQILIFLVVNVLTILLFVFLKLKKPFFWRVKK